jgi:CHASE2 domain-containing sensor protein
MASADDPIAKLNTAQEAFNKAQREAQTVSQSTQPWSPELVQFLSLCVLGFTCIALVLGTILLWRSRASAAHVIRLFGILVIIGMSGLLLVVGFSNAQLGPVIGLFGAIAGYLLGKEPSAEDRAPKPPPST